jgi:G3E family GTPase
MIRPPVSLHFISGLPASGKSSTIRAILDNPAGQRFGVIQNIRGIDAIDPDHFPGHRIELIRSTSCPCCEVYMFFYASLMVLLKEPQMDSIFVELGPEADILQLKNMLEISPLWDELEWGRSMIAFDVRDRRFRPNSVMPSVHRMIEQADILLMRFSDLALPADFDHYFSHLATYKPCLIMKPDSAQTDFWNMLNG